MHDLACNGKHEVAPSGFSQQRASNAPNDISIGFGLLLKHISKNTARLRSSGAYTVATAAIALARLNPVALVSSPIAANIC